MEADKDKMMREYRAQLDAERAQKLALGRNHSRSKSSSSKKGDRVISSSVASFLHMLYFSSVSAE
jgi:hypothetical protein